MAKVDPEMGKRIHQMLVARNLENPIMWDRVKEDNAQKEMEAGFAQVCKHLGLDPTHPSTEGTPHRLAKMYKKEICFGLDYDQFPHAMVTENDSKFQSIMCERNITVKSLCEHHFMPVLGIAHVAYIPDQKLIGLSKFNRVVNFFARRPQLQERLGQQILAVLQELAGTDDVAVIIKAEHFCVKFRGIEDESSDTVTSLMGGRFFTDALARQELMSMINGV